MENQAGEINELFLRFDQRNSAATQLPYENLMGESDINEKVKKMYEKILRVHQEILERPMNYEKIAHLLVIQDYGLECLEKILEKKNSVFNTLDYNFVLLIILILLLVVLIIYSREFAKLKLYFSQTCNI